MLYFIKPSFVHCLTMSNISQLFVQNGNMSLVKMYVTISLDIIWTNIGHGQGLDFDLSVHVQCLSSTCPQLYNIWTNFGFICLYTVQLQFHWTGP